MGPGLTFVVYLTLWWLVFLAILPMGTVSHAEAGVDRGDGGDPGAPLDPRIWRKATHGDLGGADPAGGHLAHRLLPPDHAAQPDLGRAGHRMTADARPAGPFSFWERSVALRYLRARRKDGGVALISTISFILIMLAVAILIIVMSVMNGFRSELLDRILGFNGHMHVTGLVTTEPELDLALQRLRAVPGVVQAAPIIDAQALVQGRGQSSGAIVRGMTPADVRATPFIAKQHQVRLVAGVRRGRRRRRPHPGRRPAGGGHGRRAGRHPDADLAVGRRDGARLGARSARPTRSPGPSASA